MPISKRPKNRTTFSIVRFGGRIGAAFLLIAIASGVAELAEAEESLGDQVKKIFVPKPSPTPRKHRKSSTATKKKDGTEQSPTPKPRATPEESPLPAAKSKAGAHSKAKEEPVPDASTSPKKKRKSSPTPSSVEPSPTSTSTPEESPPSSSPSPSAPTKKKGAPATIEATQISGYENYPQNVRRILDASLELTRRNLDYNYGSADPATGGMDCSGFIFYVLSQGGLHDVPRDSSQQYVWLRKAGTFRAVNSRNEDTFELDELLPGDLLFWTGTYNVERDPPITHVMIYLGREKGTNQRIMVGASDGRTYKGESRYGVSVFDFKIPHPSKTAEGRLSPSFIGFGRIPGLE